MWFTSSQHWPYLSHLENAQSDNVNRIICVWNDRYEYKLNELFWVLLYCTLQALRMNTDIVRARSPKGLGVPPCLLPNHHDNSRQTGGSAYLCDRVQCSGGDVGGEGSVWWPFPVGVPVAKGTLLEPRGEADGHTSWGLADPGAWVCAPSPVQSSRAGQRPLLGPLCDRAVPGCYVLQIQPTPWSAGERLKEGDAGQWRRTGALPLTWNWCFTANMGHLRKWHRCLKGMDILMTASLQCFFTISCIIHGLTLCMHVWHKCLIDSNRPWYLRFCGFKLNINYYKQLLLRHS